MFQSRILGWIVNPFNARFFDVPGRPEGMTESFLELCSNSEERWGYLVRSLIFLNIKNYKSFEEDKSKIDILFFRDQGISTLMSLIPENRTRWNHENNICFALALKQIPDID